VLTLKYHKPALRLDRSRQCLCLLAIIALPLLFWADAIIMSRTVEAGSAPKVRRP